MKSFFLVSFTLIFVALIGVVGWSSYRWIQQQLRVSLSTMDQARSLVTSQPGRWSQQFTPLANGFEIREVPYQTQAGEGFFLVLKTATSAAQFQLKHETQPQRISQWASTAGQPSITLNAGYFNEDFTPVGYLRIDGRRIDDHLSRQAGTGLIVFSNTGRVSIRDLARSPLQTGENFDQALQSFPFLLLNGQPVITNQVGTLDRRTVFALDKQQNVWIIFTDESLLTLHELAQKIHYSFPEVQTAINLDGGSSSGLSLQFGEVKWVKDSQVKVPTVLIIKPKGE